MAHLDFLHHVELPEDVLVAFEDVSKAPRKPLPQPPRWLARFLPGLEWSAAADDGGGDDDDDEEDDDDDFDPEERRGAAFKALDFSVSGGQGLGLVGPDFEVTQTVLFMLSGLFPPSTGRIVVRGRVAPLLKGPALNFADQRMKKAVEVSGAFLGWPRDVLRGKKWKEITEFAALDEITNYPSDSLEWKGLATRRLLQSTVLHLEASVYLVGYNFNKADPVFARRCYEVLERRQREGCAIIQNGIEAEDVSRLCQEAIYFEAGEAMFRGRLGDVASFARDRPTDADDEGRAALPLRALLLDGEGLEIGPLGGKIEIELDVFSKKQLDVEFAMVFTDEQGNDLRVERPEPFVTSDPGIYRLRIGVPGGLLGDAIYQAQLLASGDNGATEEHSLLSFELFSRGPAPGDSDTELEPDFAGMGGDEDLADEPADFEWNVRRLTD